MALETDHVYQMHEIRVRKQQFAECFADEAVKKIQKILIYLSIAFGTVLLGQDLNQLKEIP